MIECRKCQVQVLIWPPASSLCRHPFGQSPAVLSPCPSPAAAAARRPCARPAVGSHSTGARLRRPSLGANTLRRPTPSRGSLSHHRRRARRQIATRARVFGVRYLSLNTIFIALVMRVSHFRAVTGQSWCLRPANAAERKGLIAHANDQKRDSRSGHPDAVGAANHNWQFGGAPKSAAAAKAADQCRAAAARAPDPRGSRHPAPYRENPRRPLRRARCPGDPRNVSPRPQGYRTLPADATAGRIPRTVYCMSIG